MKFDNAFLTKAGKVGMQFFHKGKLLSVYADKNGILHFSEDATDEEKASLTVQYARRKTWYKKA